MTDLGSPFHEGERLAQTKAGVRDQIERKGRVVIRNYMPEQHREFFSSLPFLVFGTADREGQPWASVLFGAPGFVSSPAPDLLTIQAWPASDDPLSYGLSQGALIGCLGIELPTRRRNRANGRVEECTPDHGFNLRVRQSFGNCPKFIQARQLQLSNRRRNAYTSRTDNHLMPADIELISAADTFFIASRAADLDASPVGGLDVSHRGGLPGFVHVNSAHQICFPDYRGNLLFNTVGNLLVDARCGLAFIDFKGGSMLHVSGKADIAWDVSACQAESGVERQISVTVDRVISRACACSYDFEFMGYSPHLPSVKKTGGEPSHLRNGYHDRLD